ncbi:MAG: hypothetical protein ACYCWA_06400 [Thiobacillus sp.]
MEGTEYPGLEIDIDPVRQRREWRVKRVAWALLYAALAAIVSGVLGKGPISTTGAASGDGSVQVEYERFVRRHAPDQLRVTATAAGDTVAIHVDSAYLSDVRLEEITPQPGRVIAADGATTFIFNARPGARLHLGFDYQPERAGPLRGWIAAGDGARVAFRQFVYP